MISQRDLRKRLYSLHETIQSLSPRPAQLPAVSCCHGLRGERNGTSSAPSLNFPAAHRPAAGEWQPSALLVCRGAGVVCLKMDLGEGASKETCASDDQQVSPSSVGSLTESCVEAWHPHCCLFSAAGRPHSCTLRERLSRGCLRAGRESRGRDARLWNHRPAPRASCWRPVTPGPACLSGPRCRCPHQPSSRPHHGDIRGCGAEEFIVLGEHISKPILLFTTVMSDFLNVMSWFCCIYRPRELRPSNDWLLPQLIKLNFCKHF